MGTRGIATIAAAVAALSLTLDGCATHTQTGAAVGAGAGAVVGGLIGRASGHTARGAIIGAAAGGVAGALICHQMDTQATELQQKIPRAQGERIGAGIAVTL